MSLCDVPLCPNLSVGGAPPLMGAPKGVPRVNRASNETRDRLRIRLYQRKESLRTNKKLGENDSDRTSSSSPEPVNEQMFKPFKDLHLTNEGRPISMMIKKAGIDLCIPKQPCNHVTARRSSAKNLPENKVKNNATINKDKENKPVNVSGDDAGPILDDIDRLIEFIEGKDEDVVAVKKAAKKARQKQKKEEARRIKEEEEAAKRRAEEERIRKEKRKEEERLKAEMLAKAAALKKAAKKHRQQQQHQALMQAQAESKSKKKNKKNKNGFTQEESVPESLEETIPAMVTIKRIVENNNCPPTVTITLKGSTPDQDKLLYTLVNGHNNVSNSANKETNQKAETKTSKKKNKKLENVTTNELKVTLSVDKSFRKELENKDMNKRKDKKAKQPTPPPPPKEVKKVEKPKSKDIIDIPSLKLPPGITITKVNGPLTNKKSSAASNSDYPNVPINKSGVIVVDTEKLIQQSAGGKKNKKKKKSAQGNHQENTQPVLSKSKQQEPAMVTLKNPIFHKLQNNAAPQNPLRPHVINMNEQATISRGANGMVTIRRPRHNVLENESPEFLSPVMSNPNFEPAVPESTLSDERKIIRPPSPRPAQSTSQTGNSITDFIDDNGDINNTFFWGLPGIQITKVNRQAPIEQDLSKQMANVSITCAGRGQFNLNNDDWPFESVFTPKDEADADGLDADERELEAFKRFCQQSIPPKHKEKVAHLNVKDIVLMKKNDVTYS